MPRTHYSSIVNTKFHIIILFLLSWFVSMSVNGQTRQTITFIDNLSQAQSTTDFNNQPIPIKPERISSSAGNIIFKFDNSVPDSIQRAALIAADLWESKISNIKPIRISMTMESLSDNHDVETDVQYQDIDSLNMSIPLSLMVNKYGLVTTDSEIHGIIHLNITKQWDCGVSDSIYLDSRNVTSVTLRAIANILGFGSTATQKIVRGNKIIGFSNDLHSPFDMLVFNTNNKRLSDIAIGSASRNNVALAAFSQPDENTFIFVKEPSETYKLYAPATFEFGKSLQFFTDSNSLMYYGTAIGERKFQIDNTTIDVLKAIGWDFESSEIKIIGDGIDDTGITSAYDSHTFRLYNPDNHNLTDISWTFYLPEKSGNLKEIISTNSVNEFTIPAIENEEQYAININGDIYGEISCSFYDNNEYKELTYRVSLELKPRILNVYNIQKESTSNDFYNVSFTVDYAGADKIIIGLEQEYVVGTLTKIVYEPFIAHVNIPHIYNGYYTWVDVSVENSYGEEYYTLEFEPFDSSNSLPELNSIRNINDFEHQKDINSVAIFDINGNSITTLNSMQELESLPSGIFIVVCYSNGKLVKTIKYCRL